MASKGISHPHPSLLPARSGLPHSSSAQLAVFSPCPAFAPQSWLALPRPGAKRMLARATGEGAELDAQEERSKARTTLLCRALAACQHCPGSVGTRAPASRNCHCCRSRAACPHAVHPGAWQALGGVPCPWLCTPRAQGLRRSAQLSPKPSRAARTKKVWRATAPQQEFLSGKRSSPEETAFTGTIFITQSHSTSQIFTPCTTVSPSHRHTWVPLRQSPHSLGSPPGRGQLRAQNASEACIEAQP